ncbi:hypothetical protein [Nocardia sp. NPDC050435]|uniref:hypothetical protein n=1 Tax=Nocardia sp. NPDC050435 TaxID=3155040 RepID=UPI003408D6BD
MNESAPLLREVFPDLAAELSTLLTAEGETELAISVHDLRLVDECRCEDDFCQSLRTADHPAGEPYPAGHRTLALSPAAGMLTLDVVDGRIMYVEVLYRAPLARGDS